MAEYLDKNELIDSITEEIAEYILADTKPDELVISIANCIKSYIAMQKGITEVQPVKRGKWYHINNEDFIYCSECNNEAYWDTDYGQQLFDYCPYCGAKMIKP